MNKIDEIQALYEKATKGPWTLGVMFDNAYDQQKGIVSEKLATVEPLGLQEDCLARADSELIVALHEAWPAIQKVLHYAEMQVNKHPLDTVKGLITALKPLTMTPEELAEMKRIYDEWSAIHQNPEKP